MTAHLDEMALEALATGREDLLSTEARAHVEGCDACRELVELERASAEDAKLALRRVARDVGDLDAMIARAMAVAPPPSRRSLWLGAGIGGLAATALAILSVPGTSVGGLAVLGRQVLTLGRAADRAVEVIVPGGWTAVALIGLALALMLAVPVRLLLGSWRAPKGLATGMISLALAGVIGGTAFDAHAYRVEGEWPAARTVTLDVDRQPTSEALRLATEAAGLGLVARLPNDPEVTLHVRDAPLADVVQALLGDADVVVIPSATLLTVRPDEAPPAERPAPALAPPPRPASIGDRTTFGGDVLIREGDSVRDVFTMGGNADVRGRAFGDVVTMGGDADVRGEIIGNLYTMGGDIRVHEGARVHGDIDAMGGEIDVAPGAIVQGDRSGDHAAAHHAAEDDDEGGFFRWGLWHALLFLFGLVLLGAARGRLDVLRGELAAHPIRNMFGGAFAFLAGSLLTIVFFVTVIGIPGAAILGVMLFVGGSVGWVTAAWWLGGVLPIAPLRDRPVLQLAVGLGVLFLVGLIPTVGVLLVLIAAAAGFGAVVATKLGKTPRATARRHVPTGPFRDGSF